MRIRSAHHARRYHARDRASRPMPTLCWLPFARKIRHKELFVDLFTPTALHLSLFRFPNNINLIGSAYFEFSVTPMRSQSAEKLSFTWKKSDCFLSCFHLKLLQIFKTNLAVVFTWWRQLVMKSKECPGLKLFSVLQPSAVWNICLRANRQLIVFSKSRSAHFSEISEHKILKNCIYI